MTIIRMMRIAKLVKQFSQLRPECVTVQSWDSQVGTQGGDIYQLDTVRSPSPLVDNDEDDEDEDW